MKIRSKAINFMVVTAFMLLMPSCVLGEWFGDIYLGMHSSKADDMSIKFNGATVKTYQDSDTGSIFGGRIGYWFEGCSWLGLAADASVSEIDFDDNDNKVFSVVSFSTLLMVRLSLKPSEEFPKGRIQPYFGVGPGFFFGGLSEFIPEVPSTGRVLDDTYNSLGFDSRIGINVLMKKSYGLFLEYGFKSFSPSFDSGAPGGTISLEPTLKTHNFSLGVSFRF